ncbi:hypothetical protein COO60DRAFT_1492590, partial [Scenedesmus sp. NREL 46B-D3]
MCPLRRVAPLLGILPLLLRTGLKLRITCTQVAVPHDRLHHLLHQVVRVLSVPWQQQQQLPTRRRQEHQQPLAQRHHDEALAVFQLLLHADATTLDGHKLERLVAELSAVVVAADARVQVQVKHAAHQLLAWLVGVGLLQLWDHLVPEDVPLLLAGQRLHPVAQLQVALQVEHDVQLCFVIYYIHAGLHYLAADLGKWSYRYCVLRIRIRGLLLLLLLQCTPARRCCCCCRFLLLPLPLPLQLLLLTLHSGLPAALRCFHLPRPVLVQALNKRGGRCARLLFVRLLRLTLLLPTAL